MASWPAAVEYTEPASETKSGAVVVVPVTVEARSGRRVFGWLREVVRERWAGLIGEWCGGERELLRRGVGNGVAVA